MRRSFVIALLVLAPAGLLTRHLGAQQPAQPAAPAGTPAPQGTHTENGLAGFAKILCSAVFVSGRDPDEAAKNSAYFFMPRAEQKSGEVHDRSGTQAGARVVRRDHARGAATTAIRAASSRIPASRASTSRRCR